MDSSGQEMWLAEVHLHVHVYTVYKNKCIDTKGLPHVCIICTCIDSVLCMYACQYMYMYIEYQYRLCVQMISIYIYMNNQVYRALLRKNEKGKKEKERKLQQPQHVHVPGACTYESVLNLRIHVLGDLDSVMFLIFIACYM